jgi:hypothetical protein
MSSYRSVRINQTLASHRRHRDRLGRQSGSVMIRSAIASLALLVGAVFSQVHAYGPKGHTLVGAVADQRLAGKPVAVKVADLLDGLTLARVATLPDEIKDWDRADPATHPIVPDHPVIEQDLLAFWRANPPTAHDPAQPPPNHHWFHYTDVPVDKDAKYSGGKTGRSPFDVVHMIPYCADVLSGKTPEDNDRKITKRVALILLAHYVGDIHQPLHVGAQYFDENGKPVSPDVAGSGFADEGGNSVMLILNQPDDHGHAHATQKLHAYWDDDAVTTALDLFTRDIRAGRQGSGRITEDEIARRLAGREPANWDLKIDGVDKLAIAWADEILPIALEAHQRLDFTVHIDKMHNLARGQARERGQQEPPYHDWAGKVVSDELHKAGWRLAALVESVVK